MADGFSQNEKNNRITYNNNYIKFFVNLCLQILYVESI